MNGLTDYVPRSLSSDGSAVQPCPHCAGRGLTDPLTGLADRRMLRQHLAQALAGIRGDAGPALLMIDLDRFKAINDSLGHPIGDALLCAVAKRLQRAIRPADLAARLGGDEFAVLLAPPATQETAAVVAARLVDLLARPYYIEGHIALIGASIGIAVTPGDGVGVDTLIGQADLALYHAKAQGRGRYSRFTREMQERAEARRDFEVRLRAALPMGEFELFYQPQVEVGSGVLSGFEALLRWRRPGVGLIAPDHFIPLAEELKLITAIGAWVIRTATMEAAGWPVPVTVAVNVAAQQFADGNLVQSVSDALRISGLPGSRLELEITETALMKDTDGATLAQLQALKQLGVQISLDDFGTGYSSLSQLRSFPFDRVKIDRSFASDLPVVRAVAALAASLQMRSTAEGIETDDQLAQLKAEGCSEAQGYLISRPVPASEVRELIRRLHRD